MTNTKHPPGPRWTKEGAYYARTDERGVTWLIGRAHRAGWYVSPCNGWAPTLKEAKTLAEETERAAIARAKGEG